MNTKLTLRLDTDVIERAKCLAKREETSLSRLVEDYFRALTAPHPEPEYPRSEALQYLIDLPKPVIDPAVVAADPRLRYLLEKHS